MSSGWIIALELTVVLGGLLGLAVWELVRLRRDEERSGDETAGPASPDRGVGR